VPDQKKEVEKSGLLECGGNIALFQGVFSARRAPQGRLREKKHFFGKGAKVFNTKLQRAFRAAPAL